MDEIEPSWSGFCTSASLVSVARRANIHLSSNHFDTCCLSNSAASSITPNEVVAVHGVLLAVDINEIREYTVHVFGMG